MISPPLLSHPFLSFSLLSPHILLIPPLSSHRTSTHLPPISSHLHSSSSHHLSPLLLPPLSSSQIVIFSQWTSMLDLVEIALKNHHEACVRAAVNKAVTVAKAGERREGGREGERDGEMEGDSGSRVDEAIIIDDVQGEVRAVAAPSSSSSSCPSISAVVKCAERAAVEKWNSLYTHCRLVRRASSHAIHYLLHSFHLFYLYFFRFSLIFRLCISLSCPSLTPSLHPSLFTSFTPSLSLLSPFFSPSLSLLYQDGKMTQKDRAETVRKFSNDASVRIMLISLK
jgi:hypothetical protein